MTLVPVRRRTVVLAALLFFVQVAEARADFIVTPFLGSEFAARTTLPDLDTGVCVVLVEPTAERSFVTTQGAERRISVESLASSAPVVDDLVCVSGYSLVGLTRDPLLAWLDTLDPGVVVVLDPGAGFAD